MADRTVQALLSTGEVSLSLSAPIPPIRILADYGTFFIPDTLSTNEPEMKTDNLKSKLTKEKEIELTVTGRKSRKPIPRPVWFVLRGTELLLLPVTGTSSQWYKNILKDPLVKITSSGQTITGKLHPITGKREVGEVIQLFEKKYGPRDVKRYYPNPNVAAGLPLD